MKGEWEKLCDKFLFDFGRHVLGQDSGGIIVKLKQTMGIDASWNAIKAAAEKSSPREYIGAVMRSHIPSPSRGISEEEYQRMLARYKAKKARTA